METNSILVLVSVFSTIFIAVITFIANYLVGIKHKLFLEKLRIYRSYCEIVASSTSKKQDGLAQMHILVKQELILYAPKNIVDLAAHIEPMDFTQGNEEKYSRYLNLLNLMRKDLRKNNKSLSEDTLRGLLG